MSHFKEREEKSCLNCNAIVHGRFCHICGQENIEPRESAWHLISHFFQDITHFDGKFFSTLRYLLFKPGFLSREYMMGRRASYLNPIRMYVFTSAFFFLFFFGMVSLGDMNTSTTVKKQQEEERLQRAVLGLRQQASEAGARGDTVLQAAVQRTMASFEARRAVLSAEVAALVQKDSVARQRLQQHRDSVKAVKGGSNGRQVVNNDGPLNFSFDEAFYRTVLAYDSVQAQLPPQRRDGWWRRLGTRKVADVYEKASDKKGNYGKQLMESFLHKLPQMFFLSLPAYAFLLYLLYRRGRRYYFANHAIFTIHVYCATFIISFIAMLAAEFLLFGSETAENILNLATFFLLLLYQYKCMRNFYRQGRAKTLLKFFLLNLSAGLVVMLLTLGFLIISVLKT